MAIETIAQATGTVAETIVTSAGDAAGTVITTVAEKSSNWVKPAAYIVGGLMVGAGIGYLTYRTTKSYFARRDIVNALKENNANLAKARAEAAEQEAAKTYEDLKAKNPGL